MVVYIINVLIVIKKELINVIIAIRELLKIYLYVPNVTNKKKVKILTKKNHVKIHIVKIRLLILSVQSVKQIKT
jgi:hypothetical protein